MLVLVLNCFDYMLILATGATLLQKDFPLNSQILLFSVFSTHRRVTIKATTRCTQRQTVSVWRGMFCFKMQEPLRKTVPSTPVPIVGNATFLKMFWTYLLPPNHMQCYTPVSSRSQNIQTNIVTTDSLSAAQRASS